MFILLQWLSIDYPVGKQENLKDKIAWNLDQWIFFVAKSIGCIIAGNYKKWVFIDFFFVFLIAIWQIQTSSWCVHGCFKPSYLPSLQSVYKSTQCDD